MENAQNQKIIISGHSGFALRHTWLKKAHDLCRSDDKAFLNDNATVKLGVGKNMVQSIRFYALLCDVLRSEEKNDREHSIYLVDIFIDSGHDPYLDYVETIWLIHHKLVTNSDLVSYYEFFNSFNNTTFTNDSYREFLRRKISEKHVKKLPAEETLKRDVDCFLSNYTVKMEEKPTDSFGALLRELNLIKTTERSIYKRIYKKATDISDFIFLYVLSQFWYKHYQTHTVLSLRAISQDSESPGMVFQMHEDEVHKKLKTISEVKKIPAFISETAGIINMNLDTNAQHLSKSAVKNLLKIYTNKS